MYAIQHNSLAIGPDGPIVDVDGVKLEAKDADAYNKSVEAQELDWLKTGPDKCTLYIKKKVVSKDGLSYQWWITTWPGTEVGQAFCSDRHYMGFQAYHGRSYRRSVSVRLYGVQYHGWWMESSGDYVRLKRAKRG